MKKIIISLVLCLLMQGCVSTFKLVPQVLNGQQRLNQGGADMVISQKKARVAINPSADIYSSEDRPTITVSVYGNEKPFSFSTENIQVFVDGGTHKVFTYDELAAEIESRREAINTEVQSEYDTKSRNVTEKSYKASDDPDVFFPGEDENVIGNTSKSGYKMDVNDLARGQSSAALRSEYDMEIAEKQIKQDLNMLNLTMLKKTTVLPNTWYGGQVAMEKIPNIKQAHEIKVIVTVAGEEHEFLLNLVKVK